MQPARESAGGTATRDLRDVDSESLSIVLGGRRQSIRKKSHLRGSGSFLWCENLRRVEERCIDIAGRDELHAFESRRCGDCTHGTEAAVGRCGSSQTHDDAFCTEIERCVDELTGTDRRCRDGVVALGSTSVLQPRGQRHFDDGGAAVQTPWCLDGRPEGSFNT